METITQVWSRYLSSKADIDRLETSLLACISRLEDVETQLHLAMPRGVAVRGGVAGVGSTLTKYRHSLDKLHIAKQTCLDKFYTAFYEALTTHPRRCHWIVYPKSYVPAIGLWTLNRHDARSRARGFKPKAAGEWPKAKIKSRATRRRAA